MLKSNQGSHRKTKSNSRNMPVFIENSLSYSISKIRINHVYTEYLERNFIREET